MQEDRPRADGEPASLRSRQQLWRHVRDLAHRRLQTRLAQRLRVEEDGAALEEAHLVHRVVREDIAPFVVGGREGRPVEPTTVLDV